MPTTELYELQHQIVNIADVIACAIIKRQKPADDLVTKRALYREFGRGWVDKHIAPIGKIEGKRFGAAKNSPIKYSRTEFIALLEAERQQRAEIIGKYGRTEQEKKAVSQPFPPRTDEYTKPNQKSIKQQISRK